LTARLYLDEDLSSELAAVLRARGYDCVSAHDVGAFGLTDEEQLTRSIGQQRAIVSGNHHDFRRMAEECATNGTEHFGIVLAYRRYRRRDIGTAADALITLLDTLPADKLRNATVVLDDFVPGR
jgi:hypothetical protein